MWLCCRRKNHMAFIGNIIGNIRGNGNVFSTTSGWGGGSTMNINGRQFSCPAGSSMSIVNGRVYVDGKEWKDGSPASKELEIASKIEVHLYPTEKCPIHSVQTVSAPVIVHGNAGDVSTTDGGVNIKGNVTGRVTTTDGSINVGGNVGGNVSAVDGSVRVTGDIGGSVSTVDGNIQRR